MADLLFYSSKVLKVFTQPDAVLVLLFLLGAALLWLRRPKTGRLLVTFCALVLFAVSALPSVPGGSASWKPAFPVLLSIRLRRRTALLCWADRYPIRPSPVSMVQSL